MPTFEPEPGVVLHYDDRGEGQPVVFLPGWTASARMFDDQLDRFSQGHRGIAIEYRAHGRSSQTLSGHSLARYARDVYAFLIGLDLERVVLVGHSMGAFVAWEYLAQFGAERVAGFVNIDQPPCGLRQPGWPHGDDLLEACRFTTSLQEDQSGASRQLLDLVFKGPPSASNVDMMLPEMLRVPAPVAGVIFLEGTTYDARPHLAKISVPTLLCWGRHSKLSPLVTGEYVVERQPDARLVVFEESGHCPLLEEPERFCDEVTRFIAGLT